MILRKPQWNISNTFLAISEAVTVHGAALHKPGSSFHLTCFCHFLLVHLGIYLQWPPWQERRRMLHTGSTREKKQIQHEKDTCKYKWIGLEKELLPRSTVGNTSERDNLGSWSPEHSEKKGVRKEGPDHPSDGIQTWQLELMNHDPRSSFCTLQSYFMASVKLSGLFFFFPQNTSAPNSKGRNWFQKLHLVSSLLFSHVWGKCKNFVN